MNSVYFMSDTLDKNSMYFVNKGLKNRLKSGKWFLKILIYISGNI